MNKREERSALMGLCLLVHRHVCEPQTFMKGEVPISKTEICFRRKRLEPDFGTPVKAKEGAVYA